MAKRRSVLAEQWIPYSREMIESPALRVLSQTAIRVMHRLEAEHMNHGGGENGRLQVTYDQLHEWGMDRNAIAPAIRELVALGFVEITEPGYGGAEKGRSNRFRLTYVNSKSREVPTNEWSKIATLEKAESLASAARAIKDQRARDLGRRGARGRAKKYSPVSRSPTEPVSKPPTKMTIPQSANPRLLALLWQIRRLERISSDRRLRNLWSRRWRIGMGSGAVAGAVPGAARAQGATADVPALCGRADWAGRSQERRADGGAIGAWRHDQLHHFIASGVWDEAPLQEELAIQADKRIGDPILSLSWTTRRSPRRERIRLTSRRNMPRRSARPRIARPWCR